MSTNPDQLIATLLPYRRSQAFGGQSRPHSSGTSADATLVYLFDIRLNSSLSNLRCYDADC